MFINTVSSLVCFYFGVVRTAPYLPNGILNLYEGQSCPHASGSTGTCRDAAQCPTAQADIRSGMYPRICSYRGYSAIICCSEGLSRIVQTTAKPTRKPPALSEGRNRTPRSLSVCEKYSKDLEFLIIPFINNGDDVAEEFPHMAALGYTITGTTDIGWFCGGTLISDRYVLTAAHCIRSKMGKVTKIRLGGLSLTSKHEGAEEYPIDKTFVHPKFAGMYNDIALIKLARTVKYKSNIMPACLFTEDFIPQKRLTISGWGATDSLGENLSDTLQKATVRLVGLDECNQTYANSRDLKSGVNRNMLCTNDPRGMIDSCSGDSGGPVQFLSEKFNQIYSVVGVLSLGPYPCGGAAPTVYTRVSSYLSWIEDIVWP